jgi:flagellar basal-body rod protein FlgB
MNRVLTNGLFNLSDKAQMVTLNHRVVRDKVLAANIANAETPGYRALGYDFEKQLQDITNLSDRMQLQTSNPLHFKNAFTSASGQLKPDVFVKPNESVGQDGNTVDMDQEMAQLAENQILYQSTVELINRKIGILRYAITGGR